MSEDVKLEIVRISREFNELLPLFLDHLENYEGEIIPHIFFADLCRFILDLDVSSDLVSRVLNKLESKFSIIEDDPTSNAIAVSFVEHLPNKTKHHWIIDKLGEKMKYHYDEVFTVKA